MTQLNQIMDSLRRHEGFRQFAYKDTTGHLTIGYGRNLEAVGVDVVEAEYLLRNDVIHVLGELSKYPWFSGVNDARQGALVNMAFNIGIAGVLKFKDMISALEKRDYDEAAAAMLDSEWASQVPSRVMELAGIMKHGLDLEGVAHTA